MSETIPTAQNEQLSTRWLSAHSASAGHEPHAGQ